MRDIPLDSSSGAVARLRSSGGEWLKQVAILPSDLLQVAGGMTMEQLDTPYREGGWTVRQLVHHVADSHMNSYIRCKLALTEDTPTIKPYDEKLWAETPDGLLPPVEVSPFTDGRPAPPLGGALEESGRRPMAKDLPASRARNRDAGGNAGPVCVARPAPYGSHHGTAEAQGLELSGSLAHPDLRIDPLQHHSIQPEARLPARNKSEMAAMLRSEEPQTAVGQKGRPVVDGEGDERIVLRLHEQGGDTNPIEKVLRRLCRIVIRRGSESKQRRGVPVVEVVHRVHGVLSSRAEYWSGACAARFRIRSLSRLRNRHS